MSKVINFFLRINFVYYIRKNELEKLSQSRFTYIRLEANFISLYNFLIEKMEGVFNAMVCVLLAINFLSGNYLFYFYIFLDIFYCSLCLLYSPFRPFIFSFFYVYFFWHSIGHQSNVEYSTSGAPPSNVGYIRSAPLRILDFEHSISAGCSLQFFIRIL